MAKTIAFANQKGGVGKTTTCVNLAAALAENRCRVLLIDFDPQGNATMGSGINKKTITGGSYEVLLGEADITQVLVSTCGDYDLLPTNGDLTAAEVGLLQMSRREFKLRQALLKISGSYDFILIDCPPSLNMLTINALVAADSIIIPMQCEYYALEGLSGLLEIVEQLRQTANPKLRLQGIIRTMYDGRNCLSTEVSEQLITHFGDKVYQSIVPRNVRLAEAPSHGLPGVLYDRRASGATAYMALAKELLQQQENAFAEKNEQQIEEHSASGLSENELAEEV